MKFILFLLSTLSITVLNGQGSTIRLLPEGGISLPTGDFKSKYTFGAQGYSGGLNLDIFWGKFGVGLYGGVNQNGIDYKDDLPSTSGLITSKPSRITKDSWQQLLVGLGPIYKLDLSEKFDLEFSVKFGLSDFTYPDYAEFIETGDPLNQLYSMYETRNQDIDDKLNTMLLSAARLMFKPSKTINISLGTSYTSAMGVEHSYSYLSGDFNPEMSDEQLETALRTAPTVTKVYKCTFNSIGIILGVGFTFGGKDKLKDDQKEDQAMEPPTLKYPEDGSIITSEEADSLVLEWLKETPKVEEANYNLWLYEVRDTTEKSDSLIFQTEVTRSHQLDLPENVHLRMGITYRWWVQAIGSRKLDPCPADCYSNKFKFRIGIPVDVELQRELDGGYYLVSDGVLRLKYDEEYVDTDGKLKFNIYNDKHEIVAMNTSMPVASRPSVGPGDNRYVLNVRSCTFSNLTPYGYLGNGFYVLEVINEKNEKWYLRFKNEMTGRPNCPLINMIKK